MELKHKILRPFSIKDSMRKETLWFMITFNLDHDITAL